MDIRSINRAVYMLIYGGVAGVVIAGTELWIWLVIATTLALVDFLWDGLRKIQWYLAVLAFLVALWVRVPDWREWEFWMVVGCGALWLAYQIGKEFGNKSDAGAQSTSADDPRRHMLGMEAILYIRDNSIEGDGKSIDQILKMMTNEAKVDLAVWGRPPNIFSENFERIPVNLFKYEGYYFYLDNNRVAVGPRQRLLHTDYSDTMLWRQQVYEKWKPKNQS